MADHNIVIQVHNVQGTRFFTYRDGTVTKRHLRFRISSPPSTVTISWRARVETANRPFMLIFEEWPFTQQEPNNGPPFTVTSNLLGSPIELTLNTGVVRRCNYIAVVQTDNGWVKDDPDIEVHDPNNPNYFLSLLLSAISGTVGGAFGAGLLLALARRRQKVRIAEGGDLPPR
jgi:hypothetical protein